MRLLKLKIFCIILLLFSIFSYGAFLNVGLKTSFVKTFETNISNPVDPWATFELKMYLLDFLYASKKVAYMYTWNTKLYETELGIQNENVDIFKDPVGALKYWLWDYPLAWLSQFTYGLKIPLGPFIEETEYDLSTNYIKGFLALKFNFAGGHILIGSSLFQFYVTPMMEAFGLFKFTWEDLIKTYEELQNAFNKAGDLTIGKTWYMYISIDIF